MSVQVDGTRMSLLPSRLYGYFVIEAGVALPWLLIFSRNEFVPTYNPKRSHSDHTFYLKGQFSASVV